MGDKKKEKITTRLLIVMIISLVGSFVLFFSGHYMIGFAVGGVFMILATFLGQWSSNKNRDYVYRNIHNNNNKW
ncbi:putative membrane protein [Bacillus pakistanensis]|uniref:Membrane protein n=1 Tax=Rossellomorea pakistanensis TaxID=992288 RepID=A0ABS2N7V2_9BACI|nr:hypothetical protein [Bacillus pakistanensis]MBM7583936.1 putative membrane protein [Bacillus pakistanensis]